MSVIKRLALMGIVSSALIIGGWGIVRGGASLAASNWNHFSARRVFKAAPLKFKVTVPLKEQVLQRTGPPQYSSVVPSNLHPPQLMPSNRQGPPNPTPFIVTDEDNTGTIGRESGPTADCAYTDVYLPENMKEAQNIDTTPSTNDASATIVFDMTPPSEVSRGDCSTWIYHYGNPPSKQSEPKPRLRQIDDPKVQLAPK